MGSKRHVDKLLSVFNLTICKALGLPKSVSTRVMFIYDRKEDLRKFLILNNGGPRDMDAKLTAWLEENIDPSHIIYGLKSNELDADNLPKFGKS